MFMCNYNVELIIYILYFKCAWIVEGASHGDELFYLFNMSSWFPQHRLSKEDREISRGLLRLWTDFARTGYRIYYRSTSYTFILDYSEISS
jgi:carboxylesterase type B